MDYEKTYLSVPVIPIYGNRINIVTRHGSIMPSIPVDLERYLRIGQNYNFTTNGYAPNPGTEFAAQFFGFSLNPQFGRVMLFKKMSVNDIKEYLSKISDEALYSYNVYQIEGEGRRLFTKIEGDEDTIMGLPIKKIKDFLKI